MSQQLAHPPTPGNHAEQTSPLRCCTCANTFHTHPERHVALCPHCGQRMGTRDIVLAPANPRRPERIETAELRTAGRVIIDRGVHARITTLEAGAGVELRGELHANVRTPALFAAAANAAFSGTCHAARFRIDPDAHIHASLTMLAQSPPDQATGW